MNRILSIIVALPAVLFLVMGMRWLVAPAGIAPDFGFALATGLGLSSQVGDMSGYFLTMGICMLMGVVTGRRTWYYPPMMLLALTAVGRVLAWLLHDASLALSMIGVEVIVASILLIAARRLPADA